MHSWNTYLELLIFTHNEGKLDPNLTTVGQLKELFVEAQYFCLDQLKTEIEEELKGKDDSETTIVFNVGGTRQMIQQSIFGNIPKDHFSSGWMLMNTYNNV